MIEQWERKRRHTRPHLPAGLSKHLCGFGSTPLAVVQAMVDKAPDRAK